jgi:uncharacterized protein (TIGR02246 family)
MASRSGALILRPRPVRVIAVLLALGGLGTARADDDDVLSAIRGVAGGIDAAWDAGNAAAFAGNWSETGIVISPMGEATQGRAQIEADMGRQFGGSLAGSTHKLVIQRVQAVNLDTAIADGEANVTSASGVTWPANFSAVFSKVSDGPWLVDHTVSYAFLSR